MANEINGLLSSGPSRLGEAAASRTTQIVQRDTSDARSASQQGPAAVDAVSLTGEATRLKALEEKLLALPDTDTQRIESIRQAIADGRYRIDPQRIAERLLVFETMLGSRTDR